MQDAPSRGIVLVSILAVLVSLWLCLSQFGGIPHVSDEVSYVFQGRILASGKLWLDPPQIPELFSFGHILITKDRWCSIYTPGWPALLAIGWWMRAPWIINPLLLGLSLLLLYRVVSLVYKDGTLALIAALLFALSPFVLEMHSGFFSHPALLCSALFCWWMSEKAAISQRVLHHALCGAAAGLCFLVRPFTAVILLAPILVLYAARARARIVFAVLAALPLLAVYLVYNQVVFGDALGAGYRLDPSFRTPAFSTQYFASNIAWYAQELNQRLWGWPFPNLLLFAPLLGIANLRKPDLLVAVCALSLILSYSFYYYKDVVLGGPRFAFEATAFLAVLGARSLSLIAELATRLLPRVRKAVWLFVLVAGAAVYSASGRVPAEWLYHSDSYHGQDHGVVQLARDLYCGSSNLVLLDGNPFVIGGFYFENAVPPADGECVFVRNLPGREREIKALFPRERTQRLFLRMQELPGSPNKYADRWRVEKLALR